MGLGSRCARVCVRIAVAGAAFSGLDASHNMRLAKLVLAIAAADAADAADADADASTAWRSTA